MIFIKLFLTFFKIGLFTFGGGYAMLPLISQEVESNNWVESAEFTNFIAVSESTPGPFAINMATYIGSKTGGEFGALGSIFGSFCATLGVVLPSFIVILIVAKCYEKFKNSSVVKGCMTGLKPAVVGLIAAAIIPIVVTVLFPSGISLAVFKGIDIYISLLIFILGVVLAFKKIHPIIIICLSAALGILAGYLL